ncbi:MAG TPA: sodium/proton-translocating pyrophosphatase, partial [Chloroflexota bacterium]|nr:sodium/proton-translocating pyrophosphatase [Chloroflexota bacterium]
MIWIVPISVIVALFFAGYLTWDVLRRDTGTAEAQEIGSFIYDGAIAFIKRQYRTIAFLSIFVAVILAAVVGAFGTEDPPGDLEPVEGFGLAWRTGVAFFIGALSSAIAGIIGLITAVKTNVRTASAASRSLGEAVMVSLRG